MEITKNDMHFTMQFSHVNVIIAQMIKWRIESCTRTNLAQVCAQPFSVAFVLMKAKHDITA